MSGEFVMAEYRIERSGMAPVHPGALMREILAEQVNLPITEAARRMGISRPALYNVLNGDAAVTADMALKFGRLVGGNADLYVHMQSEYDLWHAHRRLRGRLAKIKPAA
jgi:antitoxin HigA-1